MKRIIIILVIVIVALLGYSSRITKAYFSQKEKTSTLNQTISNLNQEVEKFEVRLNDSTAVYAARVTDLNMTLDNTESYYKDLLKKNSIKPKDVNHVTEAITSTQDTQIVPVYVDTFGGIKASYVDEYASIHVDIDSLRTATIDYAVRDSLTLIHYQKKHRLFFGLIKWKENLKTVVMSKNPKTTIVGVTSIENIEK